MHKIDHRTEKPKASWHSIDGVTAATGIGRTTIYEETKAGRLKARKIGGRTVILDADLREWLASLPAMQGAA